MKVFFSNLQNVTNNKSFSPSAGKPAKVLQSWKKFKLPFEVVLPEPVTVDDFLLAHEASYVHGVLGCWLNNGFHNKSKEVAISLPWTTGSFVSAAVHAVQTGETVCSPTSGFHHANYGFGGGFCTFNGLMVAALKLKQLGLVTKVGILDIDMHFGDGTVDIIQQLEIDWIKHWTFGRDFYKFEDAEKWLSELPKIVQWMKDCDIIFYQAGADPHVDDPLGGELTTEQLKRRDKIVFEVAKKLGVPIVWNLAGGYQEDFNKVLEIHDNTFLMWQEVYGGRSLVKK